MDSVHQATTAAPVALESAEQLVRELERHAIADGASYAVARYVACAEQRAAYANKALLLLRSSRWELRNVGVKLVGLLLATELGDEVVAILEDRTPAGWLARCLGGDFRQVGFIRRNALTAIARLGIVNDRVESVLLAALSDPYFEARAEGARTVASLAGRIRTERAAIVAALEGCTRDRSLDVAVAAARALGAVGDGTRSVPALVALAEARYWRVRMAALQGLLALVERRECDDLPALERAVRRFVLASTDFQPHFDIKRAYGTLLAAIAARKVAHR